MTEMDINWTYNCLTSGAYHGRPEALWNLPLLHASYMFGKADLKTMVIARIHNDALQFVEHGFVLRQKETNATWKVDKIWADQIRDDVLATYMRTLQHTVGVVSAYYKSPEWKNTIPNLVRLVQEDKLVAHYKPRHPYDSLNMLCRILGMKVYRGVIE